MLPQFFIESKTLGPAAILLSLSLAANACSWTPQVRTLLYEGPEGSVSLITASESDFHASHPAELSSQTIDRILRGLYLQQNTGVLQGLLAGQPSRKRIFYETQISWLTPLLQKAFSQVTPEEQVNFQIDSSPSSELRTINGMMFIDGDNLVVSVNRRTRGTVNSSKQNPAVNSRNPAAILAENLVFTPEHAVRKNMAPSRLTGRDDPNQLVLNYKMLAGVQPNGVPTPVKQQGSSSSAGNTRSAPISTESTPLREPAPGVSPPASTQPMIDAPDQPADRNLLEEIQKLRERLEAQEAEIEELKKR